MPRSSCLWKARRWPRERTDTLWRRRPNTSRSTNRSGAQISMKYTLETSKAFGKKSTLGAGVQRFMPLMKPETGLVAVALVAMLISTGAALLGPVIIGRGIDTYVRLRDTSGLLLASLVLLGVYLVGVASSYTQIRTMGGVGR